MKVCKGCRERKSPESFSIHPTTKDRLAIYCKSCAKASAKMYRERRRAADPVAFREDVNRKARKAQRQLKGFIAGWEFEEAQIACQSGRCAICDQELGSGRMRHFDHDHATGKARGMLCYRCNTGIGLMFDSPLILERAAVYLRHGGVPAVPGLPL